MSAAITRILKLGKGRGQQDVPIRIFWPAADEHAWDCRWEIDWPDGQRSNSGRGIDGVQALGHAMQMIGTEIYCSEEHRSGHLAWTDDWSGYGFPVPNGIRDLLIGDDAKTM